MRRSAPPSLTPQVFSKGRTTRYIAMKSFWRLLALTVIIGHVIFLTIGPVVPPEVSQFQIVDWLIFVGVGIYAFSFYVFWGYVIYRWKTSVFEKRSIRTLWLLVIVLGGFMYSIGPLAYYIIVIEQWHGVRNKQQ